MGFSNKYLKYRPEITFDIFEKIWNKLVADGWNPTFADKKAEYNYFSTDHIYLQQETINSDLFGAHTLSCGLSETTVQEILGYDTFVRDDDFVLPKKWYVEVTTENKNVLNDWKIKQQYPLSLYSFDYKFIVENGGGYIYEGSIKDRVKITFGQFKKYVLKQDVEKGKEVIPEYVECISWFGTSFTPSKIYKVVNGKVKDNYGYHKITDWNHVDFKPSSKSAFDAQNQPKSIEKWSIGSYVVFLNSEIQSNGFNKGDIQQIHEYNSLSITYYSGIGNTVSDKGISEQIKWFATKSEAEKFAKTLVEPLKQAVHCETQEQWDFVTEKLGYEWNAEDWTDYGNNTCVNLEYKGFGTADVAYNGYQILSFSDWCAQNNYEFQSKATSLKNMFDFNVSEQTANNISETIDRVRYRAMRTAQTETLDEMFCASIDEVSKSLDNYTSELPTHAIGDGWGFVLHSNLLTVPKSYKSYCRSTRVLASPLRGFNVLILTMQIYNKYFNLPNYFAFFCRLHPTHVKTISGFYAPFYKNKIQISTDNEIKINIIQKQSIKI